MIDYSGLGIEIKTKRNGSIEFYDKYSGNIFNLVHVDKDGNYSSEYLDVSLLPKLPIQRLRIFLIKAVYTDSITKYRKQGMSINNRFDYSFGGVQFSDVDGETVTVSRTELDRHIYQIA